jgi:hypothetical protein
LCRDLAKVLTLNQWVCIPGKLPGVLMLLILCFCFLFLFLSVLSFELGVSMLARQMLYSLSQASSLFSCYVGEKFSNFAQASLDGDPPILCFSPSLRR